MGTVSSLRGCGYVLPSYKDRRTRGRAFDAALNDGRRVPLNGTEAPFGLVLHRTLGEGVKGWTISEPRTGYRVAGGDTRQMALDALAQLVAFEGGDAAFRSVLERAVTAILDTAA